MPADGSDNAASASKSCFKYFAARGTLAKLVAVDIAVVVIAFVVTILTILLVPSVFVEVDTRLTVPVPALVVLAPFAAVILVAVEASVALVDILNVVASFWALVKAVVGVPVIELVMAAENTVVVGTEV